MQNTSWQSGNDSNNSISFGNPSPKVDSEQATNPFSLFKVVDDVWDGLDSCVYEKEK